jgi:hypothetical protein
MGFGLGLKALASPFGKQKMMWAIFDVILLGISGWTQFLKSRKYMNKNIGCNALIVG